MRYIATLVLAVGIAWAQAAPDSTRPDKESAPPQTTTAAAQATATAAPPTPAIRPDKGAATPSETSTAVDPTITTPAPPTPAAAQAGMAASIAKQRASVMQQVSAITGKAAPAANSFFTVPWIDTVVATLSAAPLCDPMPSAELDKLIEEDSTQQGLKPDLVRAVISEESAGRPCAVSPKGAQGLMQLMPDTAQLFGVKDPFDPKENVDAGTKLLKQLLTKYNGDLTRALSAYNAGSARVDEEGGVPPIPETINYVKEIMAKLAKP